MKRGIWGRMWLGRGNSFDACNRNLVNQQSECAETLMRGSADADVIWQLNQLRELACGVLMEWAVDSLWFEGLFEKKNVLFLQVWHQILREPAVKQPRRNYNNIYHWHFTHSDVRPIFIIVSVSLLIGDSVLFLNNYRMILKVLSVILFSCKQLLKDSAII